MCVCVFSGSFSNDRWANVRTPYTICQSFYREQQYLTIHSKENEELHLMFARLSPFTDTRHGTSFFIHRSKQREREREGMRRTAFGDHSVHYTRSGTARVRRGLLLLLLVDCVISVSNVPWSTWGRSSPKKDTQKGRGNSMCKSSKSKEETNKH